MNLWSNFLKTAAGTALDSERLRADHGVHEQLKGNKGANPVSENPNSDDDDEEEEESVFEYLALHDKNLSSAIRIGDIDLADLKIVGELGHGVSSTVYKVRHDVSPVDRKAYAIKMLEIPMQSCFGPALEHIKNEIQILRKLIENSNSKSANTAIVKMIEALVDTSLHIYCILFEYVNGGTLEDLIKKHQTINERDLSWIARKLLYALSYLRESRIAHLDLKPTNILMNRAGDDLKLADFGASVIIDESRTVESYDLTVGSLRYMSPERFGGSRFVFKNPSLIMAADIWSLGICLLECCGSLDIFNPHLLGMGILPAIPSEYGASQELTDFVRVCLTLDPSLRPTPSQLLCHPFIFKSNDSDNLDASPSPPRSSSRSLSRPPRSTSRSLSRSLCRFSRYR